MKTEKQTMKETTFIVRQGDVLIERVESAELADEIPRDSSGRVVLAYGEVTGHAHAFHDPNVTLFQGAAANAGVFLRVVAPSDLVHEEHSTICIPVGLYRVVRQREYHPEEIRTVAD